MFKWFGGKQATTPSSEWTPEHRMISLKNDASALKLEIDTTRHNIEVLLSITTRATKDERAAIVTSYLQTLTQVNTFLNKVVH